jgi:DNA invertase Pin-like site-specific DNA recombinase
MERNVIAERTSAALAHKKANGEKTGGYAPYGYQADEHGKLTLHLEEQRVIGRMRELRADGYSYRGVAETLTREGLFTRKGTPFRQTQIIRILRATA